MTTISATLDAIYIAYWRMEIDATEAIGQIQTVVTAYTGWGAMDLLAADLLPSEQLAADAARGDGIAKLLLAADVDSTREESPA